MCPSLKEAPLGKVNRDSREQDTLEVCHAEKGSSREGETSKALLISAEGFQHGLFSRDEKDDACYL
jgi:hypothetical protein